MNEIYLAFQFPIDLNSPFNQILKSKEDAEYYCLCLNRFFQEELTSNIKDHIAILYINLKFVVSGSSNFDQKLRYIFINSEIF